MGKLILICFSAYTLLLFVIMWFTARKANNATYFTGNRKSPWFVVAYGMIGASLSGVTFMSVPGDVANIQFTYFGIVIGYILGYLTIAHVLLPLYYKENVTSVYEVLDRRMGPEAHRTGALFFIISRLLGSALRMYLVIYVLQTFVFDGLGIPIWATSTMMIIIILLYTFRGGIKTIVWTDTLQTTFMLTALILTIVFIIKELNMPFADIFQQMKDAGHTKVFETDWQKPNYFLKQIVSGMFITIVMTGLDQDMMQKNLTCKDLRSAQKDMCSYGVLFVPVNFLFLALGILLLLLYQKIGMPLPEKGDDLLAGIVLDGSLGTACLIFFTIGVIASAFSSADSAMTALTTSFCIDILGREKEEKTRKQVHLGMLVAFFLVTMTFNALGSGSVMDLIYTLVSYTYGPLLGLFAFGMFTKLQLREKYVPFITIASPLICYVIDVVVLQLTGYKFGYEMLMFNGLLTFMGLMIVSKR